MWIPNFMTQVRGCPLCPNTASRFLSPNLAANQLRAGFDLTISSGAAGHPNGIHDPAPAFCSASCKKCGAVDPPMTSGMFQLNPDG